MKNWIAPIALVLAALVTTAFAQAPAPQVARKALDLLLAEKFPELSAMFSKTMKESLPEDALRSQVGGEVRRLGKAGEIGEPVLGQDGGSRFVSFPVKFSNGTVNVQFTVNEAGEIAGVFFRPPAAPLPVVWKQAAYVKPGSFTERAVTVGTDQWKLPGVLTLPTGKGPFTAVVLVHGAGPNDRDEAVFSNKMFRDIAEGLGSRGIAVLRYDKRTNVFGYEIAGKPITLNEETIEDAVRAVALARSQKEIDPRRVFVLGHSLGGYVAPRIAARDGKLAGLILLDGNARPIEDLVLEQNEYVAGLSGGPNPAQQRQLDELKAEVAKVKKLNATGQNPPMVMKMPSGYFVDLIGYDPPAAAAKLPQPVLVLQGERDFQVTMKDFAMWKSGLAAKKNATLKSYPKLNGLMIAGDGKGSPGDYRLPGNVDAEVINDVVAWIAAVR
jgi:hypothetical protein